MKNHMLFYVMLISAISFNGLSQKIVISPNKAKVGDSLSNALTVDEKKNNSEKKIKYYHVEETTNMKFGGYTTTYNVSDPKLIRTNSLGPNNTRTITPFFTNEKKLSKPKLKADTLKTKPMAVPNKSTSTDIPKKVENYAYINILKTYERMTEKGYKSIAMLKKLGNDYFFNEEFEKAAKSYGELFSLTTELEPEYYYRYSISLKAIDQNEKASEYLKRFNQLSANKTN
jgi:tetratricopeptide (TPR) repeat protein